MQWSCEKCTSQAICRCFLVVVTAAVEYAALLGLHVDTDVIQSSAFS